MGEWDWEGKRCSVNKVQGDGPWKTEQAKVCVHLSVKTNYYSGDYCHLDREKVIVPSE